MKRYHFSKEILDFIESNKVPMGVYQYVDKRIVTLALSDGFCDLFGYDNKAEAYYDMDNNLYDRTHPDDVARIEEIGVEFITKRNDYEVIYRTQKKAKDGYIIIHATGKKVITEDNATIAYVWYTSEGEYSETEYNKESKLNVTLSTALRSESISKGMKYDVLTGLPNMDYFFELAEARRDAIIESGEKPIMLFIDVSGLKYFNHKYGFDEGSKYLQLFSKCILSTFGLDNCSRIGQDHFAAVSIDSGIDKKIKQFFEDCKIINSGNSLPVRVGIYRDEDDGYVSVSLACDRAKMACDSKRGTFESVYCYYNEEQKQDVLKRQFVLSNFDKALSEKHIQVYYQPIVRAINGKVCDEEALSRWIDPVKGLLSPIDFIPYLEEARLIYKLDLYVLERIIERIKKQNETGLTIVPISINISRSDFDVCDIVEEIRKRVDEGGIDHKLITIEVTESCLSKDYKFMKTQIERFRELEFPVWMDDFGSGYSSLDVLQDIKFDLVKFNMGFMAKVQEGERGKIILTDLLKMVSSLGIDTVCEGVETEEQVRFLKEICCSKIQGYFYCRPIPYEMIVDRYKTGKQIGFENPDEKGYFSAIGGMNLYDISLFSEDEELLPGTFNTIPMGIIEVRGDKTRFVKSNKSYREFIKRYIGYDLAYEGSEFVPYDNAFMNNIVKTCCEQGIKSFYDETMPDGSIVHSFARKIGVDPVNGTIAVAVAVLSIEDKKEGATYASIARSLAADYYNLYYIDLDTDKFIEYSSSVGGDELAMERHGENFFEESRLAADRIYKEDRENFFAVFNKENIIHDLDEQGVFTTTYRLMDKGYPMYVNMKITRMQTSGNYIIMGVSIIDAQMKSKEYLHEVQNERNALARLMALSDDKYLSIYVIDPETDTYIEHDATKEYESLSLEKRGENFFEKSVENSRKVVFSEDLHFIQERLTKENILKEIKEKGVFFIRYRLIINDDPIPVSLRIAMIHEDGKDKLVAGVKLDKVS